MENSCTKQSSMTTSDTLTRSEMKFVVIFRIRGGKTGRSLIEQGLINRQR